MVIVKLMGGMGNQMFQYALYQSYLDQGVEAKLDIFKFRHIDEIRQCFLGYDCFDLKYELCTRKEARQYALGTGMVARVLMKVFGDRKTHVYEKEEYTYDATILKLRNAYVDGFWQSWKYFESVKDKIPLIYRFKNKLTGKAGEYQEKILESNSVAVHIRKGDYVKLENVYGNICTEAYYRAAMKETEVRVDRPVYYFFSNDMEWTKNVFGKADNFVFVEGNDEKKGYIDMQLMADCKHQIIANSSFSWWAAFLNSNPDKVVICPVRWIQTKETPDIFCRDWIKIKSE